MSLLLPSCFAQAGPIENLRAIGEQTGFSVGHLISQGIAFLIVAFVLWLWAFKPVRTILEQRRQVIMQSLKDAEQAKKQLADASAERLAILHKANEQAAVILAEAEKAAAGRTELRTREAGTQAEDIIRKAREAAELERDRLMAELKREVGSLVIQTTEKVTGKVLSADDQTRLNAETLRQLNPSRN